MRRQHGRGWKDALVKGANLARKGMSAAEDMGFDIPDGSAGQNPFAGLSAPSTAPPGLMAGLANAPSGPPRADPGFTEIVQAAKTMTKEQVDNAVDLANAQAAIAQAKALSEQSGARRHSRRPNPRHKRRAKTRRLKRTKKGTRRSNRP